MPVVVHRGIQSGGIRRESRRGLADALIRHHRHTVAIYRFVRKTLDGAPARGHRTDLLEHARHHEAWSDELDVLQFTVAPEVRPRLHRYFAEVAKLARVVRLESAILETNEEKLTASLDAVLHLLSRREHAHRTVYIRHSDTLL